MIRLTIDIERPSRDDLAEDLERIAHLLREGYTSGLDPDWGTSGEGQDEGEL